MLDLVEKIKNTKGVKRVFRITDRCIMFEMYQFLSMTIASNEKIEKFIKTGKVLSRISLRFNLFTVTEDQISVVYEKIMTQYSKYEAKIITMTMNSVIYFWDKSDLEIMSILKKRRRDVQPKDPDKTLILFGKYAGEKVSEVPTRFLLFLSEVYADPYLAATAFEEYKRRKLNYESKNKNEIRKERRLFFGY